MENKLQKYAELLVYSGLNLKKNQILVIKTPIECAEFARIIARVAFEAGALDVQIYWMDDAFSKIRYMLAPDETIDTLPTWITEFNMSYALKDAAFLSILANDPDIFIDVDSNRIQRSQIAFEKSLKEYRNRLMNNINTWCVASVPTTGWAMKVFPDVTETEAVSLLWDAIFDVIRINEENPIEAWEIHKRNLGKYLKFLNDKQFVQLQYKNAIGTDCVVDLPKGHKWLGGSDYTSTGHEFLANIPTEEVFTAPHRLGVNGVIVGSLPLCENGQLIDGFKLVFENGKIVDYSAETGYEALRSIIETDLGASYLGEVALVPNNSPIANKGILFYNGLFDENAACHFAIGKAYPVCLENGDKMTEAELIENGLNDSATHIDFMIGTDDLEIMGITESGEAVPIFQKGNFANLF